MRSEAAAKIKASFYGAFSNFYIIGVLLEARLDSEPRSPFETTQTFNHKGTHMHAHSVLKGK